MLRPSYRKDEGEIAKLKQSWSEASSLTEGLVRRITERYKLQQGNRTIYSYGAMYRHFSVFFYPFLLESYISQVRRCFGLLFSWFDLVGVRVPTIKVLNL